MYEKLPLNVNVLLSVAKCCEKLEQNDEAISYAEKLIEHFQKLPSIGPKTALRLALHIIKMPENEVTNFANALTEAKNKISYCKTCFNMSCTDPCEICTDSTRNNSIICVVGETKDLMAIEKTNEYNGLYQYP